MFPVSWTLTYILCKKINKILWKSMATITCFVINCHSHLLEGTLLDYCLFCSGLHFPSPFALSVRSHCFQLCVISLVSSSIQWVRKVFRPPYIFHSLLYCSHLLKSFKFIFFLINVHTAPHIDRKTQNC